jgi:two-component system, NtrC family, sensor kinase
MTSPMRLSLKARLMIIIGGITAFLMTVISMGILYQWRVMIVENQRHNAEGVTRAIAITLTDAFLYGEAEDPPLEDLLERNVRSYAVTIPGLRWISVIDNEGRILAHSNDAMTGHRIADSLAALVLPADRLISALSHTDGQGWLLETVQPLNVGGKRWGVVHVAFDASTTHNEIQSLFFLLMALTWGVTAMTLIILYLLIGRLTDSLHQFVVLMDRTGLESDDQLPPARHTDEIGRLLHHFGLLRQRLAQSRRELVSMHQQVARTEKLASIGRLASGVAHEINNPLAGLKNCLYAIEREPENYAQTRLYLQLMKEGMEYIETVVQKLLGFARPQPAAMGPVDINAVVMKVVRLVDYNINKRRITLTTTLATGLPELTGDTQLLAEVFMNILLNAIDAVEERGRIAVSSERSDDRVLVHVRDDGMGIDPEHLAHIFDPFFTTKGPKEGTGLGLSVSMGIVEAHGGHIRVRSTPGKGAEFTVELPVQGGRP